MDNVLVRALRVDATSRSSTITAGGTAQQLMAANSARLGFSVQNQSTADLYIRAGATATQDQNSVKVASGDTFVSTQIVSPSAISIIGAVTGQAFNAREW